VCFEEPRCRTPFVRTLCREAWILCAVAQWRGELLAGCEPDLTVDGGRGVSGPKPSFADRAVNGLLRRHW
jgi:hypothetical protein